MGDILTWLYFGVEQTTEHGNKLRGCLAPDGINELTDHLDKIYMAGADGVCSLIREM